VDWLLHLTCQDPMGCFGRKMWLHLGVQQRRIRNHGKQRGGHNSHNRVQQTACLVHRVGHHEQHRKFLMGDRRHQLGQQQLGLQHGDDHNNHNHMGDRKSHNRSMAQAQHQQISCQGSVRIHKDDIPSRLRRILVRRLQAIEVDDHNHSRNRHRLRAQQKRRQLNILLRSRKPS